MRNDWPRVSLGEVVDLLTGFPFKSQRYTQDDSAPRLLRGDNVGQGRIRWDGAQRWPSAETEGLEQYWLREGDVILAMDRPWIEAGLKYAAIQPSDLPSLLVQRVARLRGGDGLSTAFLRYVVGSRPFTDHVLAVQTGTSVPHISPSQIREFSFLLPSLDEQHAVAEILGVLDRKIDVNRKIATSLELCGRVLFKSWFVDFDPTRTGQDSVIHEFVDSGRSRLPSTSDAAAPPAGWQRRRLADWADALSGGTPSKANETLWGGALPWISPKVMTEIHADVAEDFVTPEAIGNGTRLAPKHSTLIMVRGMGLHQHVRVSQARREVTFNQDVKALVPRGIHASLLLFAMLDAQAELLGRVESSGHGTGKLPSDILLAYPITMPPLEIQVSIAKPFDLINDRIALAREQSRTLAAIRDLLLPRLLTGQLAIRDLERAVEVAV